MTERPTPADWLAALWTSHLRLTEVARESTPAELRSPSYVDGWSIADVLSHLGAGAEIFALLLAAGREGGGAESDAYPSIWATWNAKEPERQALDSIETMQLFLENVDALDEAERLAWSLEFFGARRGIGELLWFRLSEHALHTWDVMVAADASAVLTASSVNLLIDVLAPFAPRIAKPAGQQFAARLNVSEPERSFELVVNGDTVSFEPVTLASGHLAAIDLSAEALIRLVYGRLDPEHTPTFTGDVALLDRVRQVFRGL